MKPLLFVLVAFGLLLGDAHAQIDKPVVSVDKDLLNDFDSCDRCVVMRRWDSYYSYECPSNTNVLFQEGVLRDEQLLGTNWRVSRLFIPQKFWGLDLLTFEFDDMALSPNDNLRTICLLGPNLQVEQIVDLNDDGISEVIATNMSGEEGSPWAYHLVALDKLGGLIVHRFPEQYDFFGPKVIREDEKTLIALDKVSEGLWNVKLDEKTFFYEFNGKDLSINRWTEPPFLQAIKEAHSSMLPQFSDAFFLEEMEVMTFDLNGDSKIESVFCNLLWRWGRMNCEIRGEELSYALPLNCKRLGILHTKTNQWHDLVCDYDEMMRFDGVGYYTE